MITFLFLGTPNLMFNDIGVTRSLLAQTYGGPGIDLWRGLPLWFRFEEPQWGVTIAWLVVVVQLAAMVWIWAVRSQGDESAENPVSTTAAAVVIVIATALLLLHHARIPVPSEGIRTTREYGPVRVQATTRPPTRIWPQPSLIWFGGNDDVTVALSSQRPLESIEARLTVLDDMTAEIQLGAHRSEQTLRGGENRRIVLRPGPGVRWRGWYYYPLRVRSDDAVPAVELVGNPNDTRNLGVGVRLGAPQFAPR